LEAATLYDENSRQMVHPQKVLLWLATFCILASPVRFLRAGLHCRTKSGRQWSRWISRRSYKNAKWWSPYTTIKERHSSLCLVQTAEKKILYACSRFGCPRDLREWKTTAHFSYPSYINRNRPIYGTRKFAWARIPLVTSLVPGSFSIRCFNIFK
jgi:hypothetical protein